MNTDILKKTYRLLISRQFAVWSLVLLALLLIVAGTLPDLSLLSEKEFSYLRGSRPVLFWISSHLQVSNLTRSPLFLVLPGAIWLSTALCMISRLRREVLRQKKTSTVDADIHDMATILITQPIKSIQEKLKEVFSARHWRLEEASQNGAIRYIGRKGIHGVWGSVVFHLSLLVLLLGIIASSLGRFDAEMVMAEGQTAALAEESMLRVNRKSILSPPLPKTPMRLKKFTADFAQDKYPVDYTADISLGTPLNAREEKVRVNHPLKEGRYQIFLHRYGFAPRFEVRDERGTVLFDAFVNLIVSRPEQRDYFDLPHQGVRIETELFPDYRMNGESAVSVSPSPKNPVIRVRMLDDGVVIGEEDLPEGQTVTFGKYKLTFAELRYWAWFGIVYDPGYWFMVIGFILCIAGLALRFMDLEKSLQIKLEQQTDSVLVSLAGRSRYFPALFEHEIDGIAQKLQPHMVGTKTKRGDT